MKKILLLLLSLSSLISYGQQYNINEVNGQTLYLSYDGDYNNEITLFDSGGPDAPYSANEFYSVTICSDIQLTGCPPIPEINAYFTFFDVEASIGNDCTWDWLGVYDSNYNFIDYYCNNNLPPFYNTTVNSVIEDEGGCLTIQFYSDNVQENNGFEISFKEDRAYQIIETPLTCGPIYSETIDYAYHGCFSCIDEYDCSGSSYSGYYGLEDLWSLDPDLNGWVTLSVLGDIDFFVYGASGPGPNGCAIPVSIACVTGDETSVSFNCDNYPLGIWFYVDSDFYADYQVFLDCNGNNTSCDDLPNIYCGDIIRDNNDPIYNDKATSLIDDHYSGTLTDGCDYDDFSSSALFENHERIYKTEYITSGQLSIDLKPIDNYLDVDLFIYEECESDIIYTASDSSNQNSDRNTNSGLLLSNNTYRSTKGQDLVDAVFIDNPYGEYYVVVDGQSNAAQSPYDTEGEYEIVLTCGDLCDHDFVDISCGESIQDDNYGADNFASYYCCDDPDQKGGNYGPEKVYQFQHAGGPVTITLDIWEFGKDLNLYLLEDCSVASCFEKSKTLIPNASEEIHSDYLEAGTYYIVVEGYCGDESSFELSVNCYNEPCNPCSHCFTYLNDGRNYYFRNSFCSGEYTPRNNESYEWSFPEGSVQTFLDNSDEFSSDPSLILLPGIWEVCLKISYYQNGVFQNFECCMTVFVPYDDCYARPPVCDFQYSQLDDGNFSFDASSSQNVDAYSWVIEGMEDGQSYQIENNDNSILNINLANYGYQCYKVTLYGTNCFGFTRFTVIVCVSSTACETSLPPACGTITPVTNGDHISFEDVPGDWDEYEWIIPEEINLVSGNLNSLSPIFRLPGSGKFVICLILKKGCHYLCLCWTVSRGSCPPVDCDQYQNVYCNTVINDNNTQSNPFSTDIVNVYDNNSCIEFTNSQGQVYHPKFRSREVRYFYQNNGFSYPLTIDLHLEEYDPLFDLDLFLFKGCDSGKPDQCIDYSGHLPPGLNESVFLPSYAMNQIDDLNIFVDGQSFTNPLRVNEGDYTLALTCGPLHGHTGNAALIIPLECDQGIENNNNTGKNFGSYYSCDPEDNRGNNWGKENIYSFSIDKKQQVEINLDIIDNADLNLYLLDELDVTACLDLSKTIGKKIDEQIVYTLNPGTYYIIVEGYTGDSGKYYLTLNCLIDHTENTAVPHDITVYPNPTNDHINIHLSDIYSGVIEAQLFNMHGQLIQSQTRDNSSDNIVFDTQGIREGSYFVRVELDDRIFQKKVVIIR